jgi:tRNA dimethylallyltransferase
MLHPEQFAEDFFSKNPKGVFVIVGPTASGKTSLSIRIAKHLGDAEIINCDSRQVYRDLSICVAAPTEEEKEGITHHLFEYISPEKTQNVSEWRAEAEATIEEIQSRGKKAILCGGTGLFVNALSKNFSLSVPPNPQLREKLWDYSQQELWDMLNEKDPLEAAKLSPNNKKYIIRALEIYEEKGKKSEIMTTQKPNFPFAFLGITYPRKKLYERINVRNQIMFDDGFLEEVKNFLEKYPNIPENDGAFIAHGVPEAIQYFEKKISLEELQEKMKQNTRNYAKRQLTWWRKDSRVRWISGETGGEILLTDEGI